MQTSKQKIKDKNHTYYKKALPTKAASNGNSQNSQQTNLQIEQLGFFPQHSRILTAIIEPGSLSIKYANHLFGQMMGIDRLYEQQSKENINLNELFSDWDSTELQQLYRQQILQWVLKKTISSRHRISRVTSRSHLND